MLPRCAVGDASFLVLVQNKLIRTLALERIDAGLSVVHEQIGTRRRRDETQVRTPAIVFSARICVRELPQRMVDVYVVGSMGGVPQERELGSGELVRLADGLDVPVGPVNVIVEDGDGKDVRHRIPGKHDATIVTLEIGKGDVVEMRVGPEYFVGEVIDGQGVGPGNVVFVGQDLGEVAPVHAHLADVGLQVPGREVQVSCARMDHDGPRIRDSTLESLSVGPVEFGDVEVFGVPVEPVEFAPDPIDRDALQPETVVVDDGLSFATFHGCSDDNV